MRHLGGWKFPKKFHRLEQVFQPRDLTLFDAVKTLNFTKCLQDLNLYNNNNISDWCTVELVRNSKRVCWTSEVCTQEGDKSQAVNVPIFVVTKKGDLASQSHFHQEQDANQTIERQWEYINLSQKDTKCLHIDDNSFSKGTVHIANVLYALGSRVAPLNPKRPFTCACYYWNKDVHIFSPPVQISQVQNQFVCFPFSTCCFMKPTVHETIMPPSFQISPPVSRACF